MLSNNLLQVGSYLSPWAMVLGTSYKSFKNYDPIAPINQHSPTMQLISRLPFGNQKGNRDVQSSVFMRKQQFYHHLKMFLTCRWTQSSRGIFQYKWFYNSVNANKISESQFSLPTQNLHPILHLNQILPSCKCAFKDRNLHHPKVFAPLHRYCCRNLLQSKAMPPPCCFSALQDVIQFTVSDRMSLAQMNKIIYASIHIL